MDPATLELRARQVIVAAGLDDKLDPAPWPDPGLEESWAPIGLPVPDRPGRSEDLQVLARSPRSPRPGALARPAARARLLHTFLHHEVQAAELFAWAFLRFRDAPRAFRRGLLRLCRDELRHGRLYRDRLAALGAAYGDFPVRDWFWERARACQDPAAFTAFVGLGLEAANLEHAPRFAGALREAGDEESAGILDRVEREEEAHVAFSLEWFGRFTGRRDFDAWAAHLPPPLTPSLFRGEPLNRGARLRAGLGPEFLERLAAAPSTRAPRT